MLFLQLDRVCLKLPQGSRWGHDGGGLADDCLPFGLGLHLSGLVLAAEGGKYGREHLEIHEVVVDHLLLHPVLLSLKGCSDLLDQVLKRRLLVENQRRLDQCQRLIVDRNGVFVAHHHRIYEARTVGVLLECGGEPGLMVDGFCWGLLGLGEWLIDGLEQLHELVLGAGDLAGLGVGGWWVL